MSTPETPAAKPIRMPPIVTPDAKFFWDACDREEFVGQRFRASGKFYFPPRPMCPETHTLEHDIVPLSGRCLPRQAKSTSSFHVAAARW